MGDLSKACGDVYGATAHCSLKKRGGGVNKLCKVQVGMIYPRRPPL